MSLKLHGLGKITGIDQGLSVVGVTTLHNELSVSGDVVVGGGLTVTGVLTYEDVTNVDSIGIITARSGIIGDLTGNVTGNVTGDITGNIIGSPTLSGISSSISDTAVDVFIYDTSKDSDGGAWRKRTQHTSWYNETLNTATRGSRKEFPAVAVIVTETDRVTIYDGDDPDLPMWMVFLSGTDNLNERLLRYASNDASEMLNAILCVATSDTLAYISFIDEYHRLYHTGSEYYFPERTGIVDRNVIIGEPAGPESGGYGLPSSDTNDVAMTVLSSAPIDSATGLPKPTIAVATETGIGVIMDSGSVYDLTTSDAYDTYGKVEFGDNNRLYYTGNNTQVLYSSGIPVEDHNYTAYNTQNTKRVMFPTMDHGGFTSGHPVRLLGTNGANNPLLIAKNKASGSNETSYSPSGFGIRPGLTFIDEGETNPTSMVAYATTSYNTGWMHGDIKGAFLSDTDATNVTGGNIVTNGDAWTGAQSSTSSTPPDGWTGGNAAQWRTSTGGDGSYIRLVNAGSAQGGPNSYMYQAITTVPGRKYRISLTQYHHATISVYYSVGTSINGGDLVTDTWVSSSSNTPRDEQNTFTATGTTAYLTLGITSGTNNYDTGWDNVLITEVVDDRSASVNGLHSFGTITKSAVATGAELVSYSGWTSSNYLERAMVASDNPGSGDYSVSFWGKTGTAAVQVFFSIRDINDSGVGWIQMWYNNTNFAFGHHPGGYISTPATYADNTWHCFVGTRVGNTLSLYQDGVLLTTTTNSSNPGMPATSQLKIGIHHDGQFAFNGELALLRYSCSAPTAAQVKKMYEDEKFLFQENAACTLYGSSDAVTALAYDEVTERLHVGTSSGRSDFQGLRRINNTTTAVTTAISAHDEFIAEQ